jgi:signal transduction histidine kinase
MPLYFTPYIILPLLSAIVNSCLAFYAWQRQGLPAARPLFWLMIGMSGWSFAYTLNTMATSLAVKVLCFQIGTSFVCLIPPAVLALALESMGRGDWLTHRRLALLCAFPLLSVVLVWTNGFHFLFRQDLHLYRSGSLLLLGFKNGPYYFLHLPYVILANFVAIALWGDALRHAPRGERPRFALLITATIVPLTVELLQLTPVKGFVMTTSSLFLSGSLYSVAIFRHRLLDVVPLARTALFAQIGEPVLVFDQRGELVDCNHAAHQLAGSCPGQNLAGVHRTLLCHFPELNAQLSPGVDACREACLADAMEESRYWRVSISPVQARGTVRGRLVLLHDISDLKRTEQMLTESERHLRELNGTLQERVEEETKRRLAQERMLATHSRLAAMGEMIGAIAHQWRQPLATLGMIVQRTHAIGTMQELTREYLDEFKSNAMRQIKYMSDTIEEFRGFYRLEKQKEPFSPFNCIADAVRLFDPQFTSSGIAVEVGCSGCADRFVNGFPNEFKQVVLNLLGNARDAILECRRDTGRPETGHIGIDISIHDNRIMYIDVSDNGYGIPADISPRIFDPYFTTKEEQGGTGIGLYMSRMIVEDSLGGSLSLLDNRGGAVFRIELPLEELP